MGAAHASRPTASPVEPKTVRDVYFAEAGGFTADADLRPGDRSTRRPSLTGPCIVEEMDSTTVIHPGLLGADLDAGATSSSAPPRGGSRDETRRDGHPARDEHVLDQPDRRRGVRAQHDQRRARRPPRRGGLGGLRPRPASPSPATCDADSLPGVDVVPIGFASTHPGGTWPAATFERIAGAQLERLEAEGPFDGVLMAQHGAMVVEGYPGRRRRVHPPRPRGRRARASRSATSWTRTATSRRRRSTPPTSRSCGGRTRTWTAAPAGSSCAQLIAQTVRGEIEPVQADRQPADGAPTSSPRTPPTTRCAALLRAGARADRGDARACSTEHRRGLPVRRRPAHGDGPRRGRGPRRLDRRAGRRGRWPRRTWEQRQAFDPRGVSVADAVRLERGDATGPIVLLDVGDNMGAGTPGDSTFILEGLLAAGRRGLPADRPRPGRRRRVRRGRRRRARRS